jgi:hypothetical protein
MMNATTRMAISRFEKNSNIFKPYRTKKNPAQGEQRSGAKFAGKCAIARPNDISYFRVEKVLAVPPREGAVQFA